MARLEAASLGNAARQTNVELSGQLNLHDSLYNIVQYLFSHVN